MATSGSVDFSVDRDEIFTEALELVGALEAGDTIDSNDITTCARSLNMMIKALMVKGVRVWKVSTAELTLVASQQSYTLGTGGDLVIDKPLRIVEARRRDSDGNDTEMFRLSRDEYMRLSNKSLATIPTNYYFLPGIDTSTLYVWPTASTTTATNDTIVFSYYSLIEDFDASANTPDFPVEWSEALAYNLAVRIAPKYGKRLADIPEVISIANSSLDDLLGWGEEDVSVYFGVDG